MPYEVKITATFITGTSASDEESAKAGCQKVLEDMLREHAVITIPGEIKGIFDFQVDKIEAEKL